MQRVIAKQVTKQEVKYPEIEEKLSVVKGNTKIGKIYAFSTLPGNEQHMLTLKKDNTLLTTIPGTCSRYCECCFDCGCYAVNAARLHNNVTIQAWGGNTLLLRSGRLEGELETYINKKNKTFKNGRRQELIHFFRINVSGELTGLKDVEMWNRIASHHPEIQFSVYTKNYIAIDRFMQKYGDTVNNLVINISQWHRSANWFLNKYPGKFNVFEYDDSNLKSNTLSEKDIERLSVCTHCPAVTKDGKHAVDAQGNPITCAQCQRCYHKTGKITAVYAH